MSLSKKIITTILALSLFVVFYVVGASDLASQDTDPEDKYTWEKITVTSTFHGGGLTFWIQLHNNLKGEFTLAYVEPVDTIPFFISEKKIKFQIIKESDSSKILDLVSSIQSKSKVLGPYKWDAFRRMLVIDSIKFYDDYCLGKQDDLGILLKIIDPYLPISILDPNDWARKSSLIDDLQSGLNR